ncbi:Uncharacterized protein Adt_39624 [Abeliophyllum distichum]|uniref:Uncharacterized protein n=1 Tax=Abeliophyllum distichum TaxID=126358 RepID=A0ABD1Q7A2_9LAMI
MHRLMSCDSYMYFSTRVHFHVSHSNSWWKTHLFFVKPTIGSFPFDAIWKHPQIRLFNSPVEVTLHLQNQLNQLINLDSSDLELNKVLTDRDLLTVGIGMEYDLNDVLNTLLLASDDEGLVENHVQSMKRRPLKRQSICIGQRDFDTTEENK